MRPLYQRLKELDPVTFERLCYHLLKEQFPTADIRHVEGGGGDEGLDLFTGDLDGGPVVWQCKAFPNGIGQSQREQIRGSLRRVLATTRPKLWVLCTSVDSTQKHTDGGNDSSSHTRIRSNSGSYQRVRSSPTPLPPHHP